MTKAEQTVVGLRLDEATEQPLPGRMDVRRLRVAANQVLVWAHSRRDVQARIEALDYDVSVRDGAAGGYELLEFNQKQPVRGPRDDLEFVLGGLNQGGEARARANRIIGCPRLMGGGDEGDYPEPATPPDPVPALGSGPGTGARVVVFDTEPVFHPAFDGHIGGMSPQDASFGGDVRGAARGHSLLVAGIILRYAPGAQVSVVKVLDDDGVGDSFDLAQKLAALDPADVDLINLSLCSQAELLPGVTEELKRLLAGGVGIVAAAGNDGGVTRMMPAATQGVVGVASIVGRDERLRLVSWSQRGPWVRAAARGVHRYGPFVTGARKPEPDEAPVHFDGWCFWDGTSFATPVVTGVAAARLSADKTTGAQALEAMLANPKRTVTRVETDTQAPIVDPPALWPTNGG